jgi:hypothetical protein
MLAIQKFNTRISHMVFLSKNRLFVNFNIPICAKWCFSQGFVCLIGMGFCGHLPNSLRNKNLKSHNPYLLHRMVFMAHKTLLHPFSRGERNFYLNFIRFGGHLDIQVSYKILQLEVPKKALILHNLPCFQKEMF